MKSSFGRTLVEMTAARVRLNARVSTVATSAGWVPGFAMVTGADATPQTGGSTPGLVTRTAETGVAIDTVSGRPGAAGPLSHAAIAAS